MVLLEKKFDDILWNVTKSLKNGQFLGNLFVAFLQNYDYNDTCTIRIVSYYDNWGKGFNDAKRDR